MEKGGKKVLSDAKFSTLFVLISLKLIHLYGRFILYFLFIYYFFIHSLFIYLFLLLLLLLPFVVIIVIIMIIVIIISFVKYTQTFDSRRRR